MKRKTLIIKHKYFVMHLSDVFLMTFKDTVSANSWKEKTFRRGFHIYYVYYVSKIEQVHTQFPF